jgi:3-isopropylmalate/(R)-2-methylmalate dehydratase small subunit
MIKGRVWRFGDDVDTDVIIPARYLNTSNKQELRNFCFKDLISDFSERVREGDIILAGENFGCGSSREHAPIALKEAGVALIIAKSFARIFFRNSLNIGLPLLEVKAGLDGVEQGDEMEVDLKKGNIFVKARNIALDVRPISGLEKELIEEGGLLNYTKHRISRGETTP